jgi:hypothetical protein
MTPPNPPPAVKPRFIPNLHTVSAQALAPFVGHYICVWLRNRRGYWFCPSAVSGMYLDGHVWSDNRWHQARVYIPMILNFQ